MILTTDESLMRKALSLAVRGRGRVEPNPLVGCVIVRDGQAIGEGFHRQFGGPHAERAALDDLAAKGLLPEGATAYVTLEPCCHTDKKTPPCVPALIEAKLKRVVVGCLDPNPAVSGKGVDQLRTAGIDVTTGMLEAECKQVNAAFFARQVQRRPYVTLKWAESADGKVAGPNGQRRQISNPAMTRAIHELRARSDAILVGINTVLNDDPMLVARGVPDARPLIRYVLDRDLRIPPTSKLVRTARETPLIIGVSPRTLSTRRERMAHLRALGVCDFTPCPFVYRALVDLFTRNITHLLVEPGPTIAKAFFEGESEPIVDRVWIVRSPRAMNEPGSLDAPRLADAFVKTGEVERDGDRLTEYLNPASPAYFAPVPSVDLTMVSDGHS